MLAVPGVVSATTSTAIGSVTILYERDRLELDEVWAVMRRQGFLLDRPRPGAAHEQLLGDAIGRALVGMLLERLLGPTGGLFVKLLI